MRLASFAALSPLRREEPEIRRALIEYLVMALRKFRSVGGLGGLALYVCLIEYLVMALRKFRSVGGLGGLALYVPAVGMSDWLSNELLIRRDLTGVWLKRGATARSFRIRSAHPGLTAIRRSS
jgi:hypothetical protein